MINPIKKIGRFVCAKILPTVFDDSLSYYESICKLTGKVNEVIDVQNESTDEINNALNEIGGYTENINKALNDSADAIRVANVAYERVGDVETNLGTVEQDIVLLKNTTNAHQIQIGEAKEKADSALAVAETALNTGNDISQSVSENTQLINGVSESVSENTQMINGVSSALSDVIDGTTNLPYLRNYGDGSNVLVKSPTGIFEFESNISGEDSLMKVDKYVRTSNADFTLPNELVTKEYVDAQSGSGGSTLESLGKIAPGLYAWLDADNDIVHFMFNGFDPQNFQIGALSGRYYTRALNCVVAVFTDPSTMGLMSIYKSSESIDYNVNTSLSGSVYGFGIARFN